MTDGCEVIADLNGHEHPILSGMSCFLCVNMPNIISQCIYCHTITVTSLRAKQNWRNPLCNMNVSDVYKKWKYSRKRFNPGRPCEKSVFQFNFFYIAPNHNDSCLTVLYILYERETPSNLMSPLWAALGNSGKEKLTFNKRGVRLKKQQRSSATFLGVWRMRKEKKYKL